MSEMMVFENVARPSKLDEYLESMRANALPDNAYVKVGENPDGTDMTMVAATFKFAVEKGKKTEIQISDKNVAKVMYDLQNAHLARGEVDKYIARKLYTLSTYDEAIKKMNFDSAIDLYTTVFGVSKDKASKYLRIGKYFINDDMTFNPVIPANWSMSHVQELLQYLPKNEGGEVDDAQVIPAVVKWVNDGTIADGMTTKKIREAMKALYLPEGGKASKGSKASKGGKDDMKEGEASKGSKSDVDVSVIDRLSDMDIDARVGHALNALDVLSAVFATFDMQEDVRALATDSIEALRDMAHRQIKG